MEHLNRGLKGTLRNLQSNLHEGTIDRAGKSVGVVHSIALQFGKEMEIHLDSDHHCTPAFSKDLDRVVATLQDAESLSCKTNRKFTTFKRRTLLLDKIDDDGKIALLILIFKIENIIIIQYSIFSLHNHFCLNLLLLVE